jgi:YfiH family protein
LGPRTFKLVSLREHNWVECAALSRIPWLIHAFPTRSGEGDPGGFFSELGAATFKLASLRQKHSAIIYTVSPRGGRGSLSYGLSGYPSAARDRKHLPPLGDALMTNHPGILLSVRVADCMPILMVDGESRAVAAVHAGWRGALESILEKTAGEMRRVFRSQPEKLIAAIGPSIRGCCYEVGEELVEAFCGRFERGEQFFRTEPAESRAAGAANRRLPLFFSQAPPGHQLNEHSGVYLDLVAAARYQLEQAGVPPTQIYAADYCTSCRNDLFYSFRKEGSLAGRMMAVIGIRPAVTG